MIKFSSATFLTVLIALSCASLSFSSPVKEVTAVDKERANKALRSLLSSSSRLSSVPTGVVGAGDHRIRGAAEECEVVDVSDFTPSQSEAEDILQEALDYLEKVTENPPTSFDYNELSPTTVKLMNKACSDKGGTPFLFSFSFSCSAFGDMSSLAPDDSGLQFDKMENIPICFSNCDKTAAELETLFESSLSDEDCKGNNFSVKNDANAMTTNMLLALVFALAASLVM